ncbi:MAG TPA: prolipoprotein diacylglyceryl transferase family protein [Bryobacteraceae bacterium]|nr:prolipoprotein diacylglyceryl transferase family protein [Bryobacteraceae bacterium]
MSGYLDRLARVEIRAGRRLWPPFQVCGSVGLAMAVLLAMTLVRETGLSWMVMAALIAASIAAFVGLALATKVITGEERIIYYHHEIAVILVSVAVLRGLRQPVLPYLDITVLGIGVFLACGRVGCLMVGCCHGRPCRWGIRYGEEHAAAGFPHYMAGARLFPVQALESLWVLAVVAVGAYLVLRGGPPGTAFTWYIVGYGAGRFCFEFLRGDAVRPYFHGISQAQWISVLSIGAAAWEERSAVLAAVAVGLILLSFGMAESRRPWREFDLRHPRHVREIASALDRIGGTPATADGKVNVACTSYGLQISGQLLGDAAAPIRYYAFARRDGPLSRQSTDLLTEVILHLRPFHGTANLVPGNRGVFHLIVHPAPTGGIGQ